MGTLSLEFTRLGELTGNNIFIETVARISRDISSLNARSGHPGVYPTELTEEEYFPQNESHDESHDESCDESRDEGCDKSPQESREQASPLIRIKYVNKMIRYGGHGDSFYEYLLKRWLLSGKKDEQARRDYEEAAHQMITRFFSFAITGEESENEDEDANNAAPSHASTIESSSLAPSSSVPRGFWFLADGLLEPVKQIDVLRRELGIPDGVEITSDPRFIPRKINLLPRMEHLACFSGGMLALGSYTGAIAAEERKRHLLVAEKLTTTCAEAYVRTASGLGPEVMHFTAPVRKPKPKEGKKRGWNGDSSYLLRPEAMESLYYLFKITGKGIYREYGAQILDAIERHCKLPGKRGYVGIKDVENPPKPFRERRREGRGGREGRQERQERQERDGHSNPTPECESIARDGRRNTDLSFGSNPDFDPDVIIEDLDTDILETVASEEPLNKDTNSINNVDSDYHETDPIYGKRLEKQETFFLAETLKYAFLLFQEDDTEKNIDLNQWVFNTEAHPLKVGEQNPVREW